LLLDAGFHVIMRPHYQSCRQWPEVIETLRSAFADHERFEYVGQMGETASILRSNILISDWSAMALEYALGLEKPVLFIDVARRIRNPNWRELGLEPVEASIRSQVGEVLPPDCIHQAPDAIRKLLRKQDQFRTRMRELREEIVYRLGHSIPDGAAEIARLADGRYAARKIRDLEGEEQDG
jgi:YidC/Oxa1 family membrane protein insertase